MNDEYVDLVRLIQDKEQIVRDYLNHKGRKDDPVKIKHLEMIIGHFHSILLYISPRHNVQLCAYQNTVSLTLLIKQIKELDKISTYNAWELSDMLDIELIRLGDDTYLFMLLKAQKRANNTDSHRWEKHFPADYLETLLNKYNCGEFNECSSRLEARCFLEYLQQKQVEEYRYDRAKVLLRGKYLGRMAGILFFLLIGLFIFYIEASQNAAFLLSFVLFEGATGSVLSHAFKLGKQPLHAETDNKTAEPPLGIRSLISEWKVFVAQPVIGATAALIIFLVFKAGLVQIGGMGGLSPEGYGLVAFLAGFSEPYFIGILDQVGGHTVSPLR